MALNRNQRNAVRCNQNLCLDSCPGSGKTKTVVAKVLRCIEDVRDTTRRIACITYTHAAVNEIENRLREFGVYRDHIYYEIVTIHSFCLNQILRPFHYRLPEFRAGFEVLPPDSSEFKDLVARLVNLHSLPNWTRERFEGIQREMDGGVFIPKGITPLAATDFLTHLDRNSHVTFSEIVYHAYRLTRDAPFIARGLASRFAWMIIDEFQDTTTTQVAILREMFQYQQTKFFLVGDPNQSIFRFAGAHPELMPRFAEDIRAQTDIRLPENYRCSSRIVEHAGRLCPRTPRMVAVGKHKDYSIEPMYVHAPSLADGVFEHFVPALDELNIRLGEAAIVGPQWRPLYDMSRELRARNIPVIGPGARPYRRSRDFAQLAEHACAYVHTGDPQLTSDSQRALFFLLLNINGNPDFRVYSYGGKTTLFRIFNLARDLQGSYETAAEWLRRAAVGCTEILLADDFLPANKSDVLPESAQAMIDDMEGAGVDLANFSTEELGLFARPKDCLSVLTMHRAKGREFDAVAIVDLHDDKVPHFSCEEPEEFKEARRLLYVAVTRARKVLMYLTDSSRPDNRPSRYLGSEGLRLLDS